ncbi:MAG: hypothetical protein EAZ24_14455, partial [Burkholderiales bacterium]
MVIHLEHRDSLDFAHDTFASPFFAASFSNFACGVSCIAYGNDLLFHDAAKYFLRYRIAGLALRNKARQRITDSARTA